MAAEDDTRAVGPSSRAPIWWALAGVLAVVVAVVAPILAPVMGLLLVAAGVSLRKRPEGATIGTLLLAVGIILLILTVVVLIFGISVSGGGS